MKKWIYKYRRWLFWGIFAIAVAVRVWRFGSLPGGLNQDEASMAYDAYGTAFFGIDRNGFHLPAYPISWGSGQNALLMYLTVPIVRLFGLNVFTARIVSLIFGLASVPAFYFVGRWLCGVGDSAEDAEVGALLVMFLLAVCPWHVMLSRWGLESNLLPGVFLFGVLALMAATRRMSLGQSGAGWRYALAAGVFAISMYAYSTVVLVMPIFLISVIVFLWRRRLISVRQTLVAGGVFLFFAAPLVVFYIVNVFKLDSVITPFFSAPRLTALRGALTPKEFFPNLARLGKLLVLQDDGLVWNRVKGVGLVYRFMTPFALVGIWSVVRQRKASPFKSVMLIWFCCAVFMCGFITVNVNRANFIFIPLIYLIGEGVLWVANRVRFSGIVVVIAVLVAFVRFGALYFGKEYSREIAGAFYRSYDEAIAYAYDLASTDDLTIYDASGVPHTLMLFYTKPDPCEFARDVVYSHPDVEFRPVTQFGRFVFTPSAAPTARDRSVYILWRGDLGKVDESLFEVTEFENFAVALPR